MFGGAYLCFEGAEKVFHAILPHADSQVEADLDVRDPAHLEESRVRGAIKTDFILSAEIMTITLAAIPPSSLWMETATLAVVAVAITVCVYGAVALIVKMDDIGLYAAATAKSGLGRSVGRGLVKGMPKLMTLLSTVGTAAMLWVGGSIILHGLVVLGWPLPYDWIHHLAEAVAQGLDQRFARFASWLVAAVCDGVLGLLFGLVLIPVVTRVVGPLLTLVTGLFGGKAANGRH